MAGTAQVVDARDGNIVVFISNEDPSKVFLGFNVPDIEGGGTTLLTPDNAIELGKALIIAGGVIDA